MTDLSQLKFFIAPPHDCSYLEGEEAITLFADPKAGSSKAVYNRLSQLGFRRSGDYLYRPHCENCSACISVRVPVNSFKMSKRQKRICKRNQDLTLDIVDAEYSDEHYELYCRYMEARHQDGDMYPPDKEQYNSFLLSDWSGAQFCEWRLEDKLVAVAVMDPLEDAFSAVYSYFDPDLSNRSLGVYAILCQIEAAKDHQLNYLYLGYWIKDCQKMAYKVEYRPLEMLVNDVWVMLN